MNVSGLLPRPIVRLTPRPSAQVSRPVAKARSVPRGFATEWIDVVGESYYQDSIAVLVKSVEPGGRVDTLAELRPERNPHDKNAVAVYIAGLKVGHLSRYYAKKFRTHSGASPCEVTARVLRGDWKDDDGRPAMHSIQIGAWS